MALTALVANYVNYGNGTNTGYYAVTVWPALTAQAAGVLRRQAAAPSVGSERVFVCIIAGTTLVSEPSWTTTRGAKTAETLGPTWQECTGQPATNGDLTNTKTWTQSHAVTASPSLGVIVKDASNNLFIVSTAGGADSGAEPSWNTTKGNTTTDGSVTWTCISNGAFAAWAAPHARLANAFAANWGSAGDDFYLSHAHAETQNAASNTLTSPGTAASPCRILCASSAGSLPPVAADLLTTATITTTGTGSIFLAGFGYWYGVGFSAGTSSGTSNIFVATNTGITFLDSCSLALVGTSASASITVSNGDRLTQLRNVTMAFGNAAQGIQLSGSMVWTATPGALVGGTMPTTLFYFSNDSAMVRLRGVDLSGTNNNLINLGVSSLADFLFENCKISGSATLTTGTVTDQTRLSVRLVACDSAAASNRYYFQNYMGIITQETTIVRTGGASDGTTPVSRKMVSSANSKFTFPLVSDPLVIWNDGTSAVTVSVPVVTDGVTLTSADAWIEVQYLGSGSTPQASFASGAAATVLTTGSSWALDSTSSWNTTGLSSPVKQTLSVSFTPAMKGPFQVRVHLARASTTLYFDPLARVA